MDQSPMLNAIAQLVDMPVECACYIVAFEHHHEGKKIVSAKSAAHLPGRNVPDVTHMLACISVGFNALVDELAASYERDAGIPRAQFRQMLIADLLGARSNTMSASTIVGKPPTPPVPDSK